MQRKKFVKKTMVVQIKCENLQQQYNCKSHLFVGHYETFFFSSVILRE